LMIVLFTSGINTANNLFKGKFKNFP